MFCLNLQIKKFLNESASSAHNLLIFYCCFILTDMLRYGFNFVFQNRCVQLMRENEIFKRLCFKNEMTSRRRYFSQMKYRTVFGDKCIRSAFQKNNFNYKKPAVLLSGLLSFFGLQEKQPEEPELIIKIKRGILAVMNGQYEEAERIFHEALNIAQNEKDEDGITYVYDMLANLAFQTGKHSEAEKLYVSVLQRLLTKGEKQDSNKVVHISLKLAKIFQDMKEFKKAEQGYTFCIETLDKKLEEQDEDSLALWGMSMDWYARFLLIVDKKNEAFECFKRAYDMCVRLNGEIHKQTAVLLNDLGTVSSLMGDNEMAMSYFERARDIVNKLPEIKDLTAIYINLGHLYLLREMYKESRKACEEGLRLAKSFEDEVSFLEAKQCLESIEKVFKSPDGTNKSNLMFKRPEFVN